MEKIVEIIKSKLDLTYEQIKNIITLLDDGSSIAFIARYRKDFTDNATDEVLIRFYEEYEYALRLLKRKEEIESILKQRETLSSKLQELLNNAKTLTQLEDIYEPYKGTKNTRADDAIKKGLTGLANIITSTKYSCEEVELKAKNFLNKEVQSISEAIAGAKDIIALRYSQELKTKDAIRRNIASHGVLVTKATKTFQKDGLYKDLVDIQQKANSIKPHRLLAILRATNEKQLNVKIEVDEDYLCNGIKKYRIKPHANSSSKYLLEAYIDGLKRLLLPSLKREYLNILKSKAERAACELFGKNLSELLLTPPLVNQVILGIDPGYKTGCKCAVIGKDGHYIDSCVIYLLNEQQTIKSSKLLYSFIQTYKVTAIAIGNGTASKETAKFISQLKQEKKLDINYAVVSEIGASVYSASKIAQEEYPNLDVTIRGAISIASRLRDPMSALVKIDPKSLGIGQYQHDINQKELAGKLESTTTQLVNKVGVDINSASYKLLSYVSGISEKLAKNIIEYRDSIGGFQTKKQILEVKGVGAKAYEQCVGFIRIKNGKSYLDNTGIHPESYAVAKYLKENYDLTNIANDTIEKIAQNYNIGTQSLQDIIFELQKPGYDIREELEQISFCEEIKDIEQLQEGDFVNGVVRNITDFGAFVDIGLKNDALLHISKISQKRVSHPMDVLSVNQQLKNIIIDSLDKEKNKVGLSLLGNSDATHYR